MLSHPCGPKRRRYDILLSSLPTAAAWLTHLRQAGPLGGCLGTKMEWEAQLLEARSREQQAARQAAAEGHSAEPEELEADFRGMVRPLRRATPGWAAPGELWRQVADPIRDNTPKRHGVGYKNGLPPSFKVASGRELDVCGVRAACRCGGTGVSPSRLTKVTTKRVATRCVW